MESARSLAFLLFAATMERVIPLVPSYFMYPAAGASAQSIAAIDATIAVATIGSASGALLWYFAGRQLGEQRGARAIARFGRFVYLDSARYQRLLAFLRTHPVAILVLGQLVPGIRIVQLLPAGVAGLPLGMVGLCTTCGTLCWITPLVVAGYLLAGSGWSSSEVGLVFFLGLLSAELVATYWMFRRTKRRRPLLLTSDASVSQRL